MNKKIIVALFFIVILVFAFVYKKEHVLNERQASGGDGHSMFKVETTFYPLAEFTAQVGRELVSVNTLVPAGTEPHDFEPSTQDIAKMHNSKMVIYNGAGFEGWLDKVLPDVQKSGVMTVDSSQNISLLMADTDHDEGSGQDPHIWLDPVLAQQQVINIENALIKADPANEAFYRENAEVYLQKLAALHTEFKTGLSSCKQDTVVTSHAAFGYLAKRYNFKVQPISGLSPDEEPSTQRMAEIAELVKEKKIKYVFFEEMVSPVLANTIAKEAGVNTLVFNPLEGLTPEDIIAGKEYISVQRENLQNLRTALECQ